MNIHQYQQIPIDRPWVGVAFACLVSLLLGAGLAFTKFNIDYRVYFSADNPQLIAFEQLQDVYSKQDNIMFVLAPENGNVFTAKMLSVIEKLTEKAWFIPFTRRVDSLTNFQHSYAEEDDLIVENLVEDAGNLDTQALERIRKVALSEILLVNRLVSSKGHVSAINATLQLPGKDLTIEVPEAVAFARKLARDIEANHSGIRVHLTGIGMLNNAFPEASIRDLSTLIPVMYGVLIVFLWLFFRSAWAVVAVLVIVALSTSGAIGLAGWLGIGITPPSAISPTIVMTLAVADSVHILNTMFHQMHLGQSRTDAIRESIRINMQPVFITSLTTAIGFLGLNVSDSPPFQDLGNIAAIGATLAFVLSVTLLPAIAVMLPLKPRAKGDFLHARTEKLADFTISFRKPVLIASLVVMVALAAFIPRIELDDNFVEYFDDRVAFRTNTEFVNANLTGPYTLEFSLPAGESGDIANPQYLAMLEAFAGWFQKQPGVLHVNHIGLILKRLNKNLHGDDPAYDELPEDRKLASQYLLLYEMSLPNGLGLTDQINLDKSSTRFTVTLAKNSTVEIRDLERRAHRWLKANVPAFAAPASGAILMFAHISKRNIESMLQGGVIAVALIALTLVLALGSLNFGILSVLLNGMPMIMAYGVWAAVVGTVGLATSVISVMMLGVVVDDTVHFLSKYLRGRRERSLSPADAVRYAISTVGSALIITSAVLIAGFLVLVYSSFRVNAEMGVLAVLTIAFALAVDLLFLPALLLYTDKDRNEKPVVNP